MELCGNYVSYTPFDCIDYTPIIDCDVYAEKGTSITFNGHYFCRTLLMYRYKLSRTIFVLCLACTQDF